MCKIAVITPTIKARYPLLLECQKSVQDQTFRAAIHVCKEDILAEGAGAIRNQIIENLPNEINWLAFLDDDDIMLPNHLECLINARHDSDIIYSDCQTIGHYKTWTPKALEPKELFIQNYIPVTVLIRRSFFEKMNGFNPVFCEDWDLWRRSYLQGGRFTYVPKVTWLYRRIGKSVLTTGKIVF